MTQVDQKPSFCLIHYRAITGKKELKQNIVAFRIYENGRYLVSAAKN